MASLFCAPFWLARHGLAVMVGAFCGITISYLISKKTILKDVKRRLTYLINVLYCKQLMTNDCECNQMKTK